MIVNHLDSKVLFEKDKTILSIYKRYDYPPNWQKPKDFVTLAKIILGQQVSLAAADSHFNKLQSYLKDFIPQNILKLSDEEMRACYISRQKSKYLRDLASHIIERKLDLEDLKNLSEKEVRTNLCRVKGIGEWTADIYLMFSLQYKDIFPKGDIAVINTMKELYQIENQEEAIKISEKWRPYRSLASYFMWHYYLKKRGRIDLI